MKNLFKILIVSVLTVLYFTSCDKDPKPEDKTIAGGLVEGVWIKGSTITINGHIEIPEGKSLTIEEGVKVIFNDTMIRPEFIVKGNLYCKGTAANPILFSVPENMRTVQNNFARLWGGIIAAPSSKEILLLHTIFEYAGAITTEESPSVKAGLFKAVAGEGVPVLNFVNNVDGKVVIMHCTFRNLGEDGLYLEGGKYIIAFNTFATQGLTGGDAINIKSGCLADVAFNFIYSSNTNGLKLSNSGDREPQAHVIAYNNTLVNAGWRRPTVKGGSIWLESGVYAELYNNLLANCRFGIKNNKAGADPRSIYDYTYYYGYTQQCVNQFQVSEKDVVRGPHDIAGTTANENNPKFANYPVETDVMNSILNPSWDFH